jgi:thioredoxin reductase (NADPH)
MLTSVSGESEGMRFPTGEALGPSDPNASESETFPRLSPDQVERVIAFGVVQLLQRGTVLFERGDRRVD